MAQAEQELFQDITKFSADDFLALLIQHDYMNSSTAKPDEGKTNTKFSQAIFEAFQVSKISRKVVVGFDIFGYSNFEPLPQTLVPLIFFKLHQVAIETLHRDSLFFPSDGGNDLKNRFISTGDGGFQIVDTPIHAIVFLSVFNLFLNLLNSGEFLPNLGSIIKKIEIRYAVTMGSVYQVDHGHYSNLYGNAIIKNARIMSKDKLDRLLVDDETHNWFLKNIQGIENLSNLTMHKVLNLPDFRAYDSTKISVDSMAKNVLHHYFSAGDRNVDSIIDVISMKIGEIHAKTQSFSVYNIYLKELMHIDKQPIIIGIGNINATGLGRD